MITIYAVRHGETTYNHEDRVQGNKDSLLTATGKAQAEALAEHFRNIPIDAVYASPLIRAYETAERIAETTGKTITVMDDLKEISCGIFEGMLIEEIRRTCWDEWRRFLSDPSHVPEAGESMNQLHDRVSRALDSIVNSVDGDRTIVIVGHAGGTRMALSHFLNISVAAAVNFGLSNASIARFVNKYGHWTCMGWNDTSHLGRLRGHVKEVL